MVETVGNGYTSFGAYVRDQQSRAKADQQASADPRTIHDTIEISSGAKIVNVARGYDLAAQIRAEKDPAKVRQLIKSGGEDIRRIGRLFSEVLKGARDWYKSRA